MGKLIVTGKDLGRLEGLLVDRVASIREETPWAPVRILAGSDLLCRHLKTSLACRLGGIFNTELLTFPRLSARAARKAGLAEGRPLPPFFSRIMLEQMKVEGILPEGFQEISASAGFSSVMAESLEDLAEGGMTGRLAMKLARPADRTGRLGDLLRLFSDYREKVEGFGGDAHSRVRGILEAFGREQAADEAAPLLVYGFYDMNEEQWRLLLSTERDGIVMFVPRPPGREGRFAGHFIDLALREGFEKAASCESVAPASPVGPPKVIREIFNAYDGREEAGEIASRVLDLAAEGTSFSDMAVLKPPGYDDRDIREYFTDSGIPLYIEQPPLLETARDARILVALASLMEGTPGRRQLVDLLMMLGPAGEEQAWDDDAVATWVKHSADEGMTGEGGWVEENAVLIEKTRIDVEKGRTGQAVLDALVEVSGMIERMLGLTRLPEGQCSWSSRMEKLFSTVEGLVPRSESLEEAMESAGRLIELDRVTGSCPPRLFVRMLGAILSRTAMPPSSFEHGSVHVLPLYAARGLRFDVIFIPGLTEDLLPGRIGRDPFLNDESREFLELESGGDLRFSRRTERPAELELLLHLAAGGAGSRLFLSYPRREKDSGRERIPSSMIERLVPPEVSAEVERIPAGTVLSGTRRPLGEDEYSLVAVARCGEKAAPLLGNPFFEAGIRMMSERWRNGRLTAFDGVISSKEGMDALKGLISRGNPGHSPTSLERWAACPFAYFISDILRVSQVEEPETVLSLDPLHRGILVHDIMEGLYRVLKGKGLLPLSRDSLGDSLDEASALMEERFEEFERDHPTGPAVFWAIEKENISRGVASFLEAEAVESGGFVPRDFEYSFGSRYGTDPVRFETGEREVEFYGRIDRIDVDGRGRFRVIDYKTGRLRGRDDDLGEGSALQLPVYLLAASRLVKADISSGTARYASVNSAGGKRNVTLRGSEWKRISGSFARIIDVIAGGIESGLFFVSPAGGGCRGCDAMTACPSSRSSLFERKVALDERCAGFIGMKQGGME